MLNLQEMPLHRVASFWGRILFFLYGIMSFVAYSELLPQSMISIFLYAFSFLGLACALLKLRLQNPYILWFLAYIVCSVPSMLINRTGNWTSTAYVLVVIFVMTFAISQFTTDLKGIKWIAYAYALGADALYLILLFTDQLHEDSRLGQTLMGNANTFAMIYMFAAILVIWLVLNEKKWLLRIFLLATLVVCYYCLLLSGGRKFVIIPILFLYINLLFRKDKKGRNHILLYTAIIAFVVGLLYYLMMNIPELYESIGYRMEYLINAVLGKGDVGGSLEIRDEMRQLAFVEGGQKPIFGHGFDSFKYLGLKELNFFAYSHCNWSELFYNQGAFGFIVYYFYYAYCAVYLLRHGKDRPEILGLGLGIIISLVIFEYGCVTYYEYLPNILLCLVGICCTMVQKGEKEHEQAKNRLSFVKA